MRWASSVRTMNHQQSLRPWAAAFFWRSWRVVCGFGANHVEKIDHQPVLHNAVTIVGSPEALAAVHHLGQAEHSLSTSQHYLIRVTYEDRAPVGQSNFDWREWSLTKNCLKIVSVHFQILSSFLVVSNTPIPEDR